MSKEKRIARIAELENQLRVAKSCELFTICEAYRNLDKCGQDRYLGSAVTITIKNINTKGKNVVVEEVSITDGLSQDTIDALKRDILRGYSLTMSYPHNKIKEVV